MSLPLSHPPRVDEETFIGIAWGGVTLAALFFIGRIGARIHGFGRLFWDDALVFASWSMFLTNTIIWQLNKDKLYENLKVSSGLLYPVPASLPKDTETYLKATVAVIIFFYSGLWFIKFSFLVFFKPLGDQVKGQNILWWTVCVITVSTWLASLGTLEYRCLLGSFAYLEGYCLSEDSIRFQHETLTANMAMDVITDALIISIPVNLLWRVQISLRQRLALGGIFSLTVFIMIFAIVRVAVVLSWSHLPDESWLYMWSSIEQTVSSIIACLASFRVLFTKQDATGQAPRTTSRSRSGTGSSRGFFKSIGFWTHLPIRERFSKSSKAENHSYAKSDSRSQFTEYNERARRNNSNEDDIPLNQVQVRRDYEVTSVV